MLCPALRDRIRERVAVSPRVLRVGYTGRLPPRIDVVDLQPNIDQIAACLGGIADLGHLLSFLFASSVFALGGLA